MSRSYNKKVKLHEFQLRDLILREKPKNYQQWVQKGKFEPDWLGPYIVTILFGFGANQVSIAKGEALKEPLNTLHMKWLCS